MIIDVDSTIIRTKADKQDAAPTYKRTYGHYPVAGDVCGDQRGPRRRPIRTGELVRRSTMVD